ncbi:SusC/RagA family TonB-linked outer membrane protein [Flavitalea sp. BT771]|uniref:SusC/RagA family TonB-linked outer membrane protein n=1 Tax=Flavitalea sp. BT771 TaxID=3063329 RepID=UPI0026E2619D|nr:SusC/RagA family TonB-linked outer membrane protein [Flavitalea sp. BT771]MDO6434759.1 SusC/RagA family TonB-linked outer membrane protein [Flavitalea sp. BT771]MDV6223659.1 SusC/RagA family TonB-linked outer membrane protein [Flavitalea sp. BT771]
MRKFLLLPLCCLLLSIAIKVQAQEVTGKVVDSAGNPLSGATLKIKGIKAGVSAGADGSFRLKLPREGVLVVSAVGYSPREVRAVNGASLTITLSASGRVMNEVVVTAIGISREKRELGSATQTINADQLNNTGTGNPLSELNGKASGLTVINSSGDPGAGTYIRLRGVTSITGNNQPLMVVDGVPIDNSINNYDPTSTGILAGGPNGNLLGGVQPTNRGVDLNPNDIESVTLLKGPAATALYGIQASSGALIITTKKGGAGQGPVLTFNSSFSVDKVSKLPERQNIYSQGDGGIYKALNRLSWGARIDTLYRDGIRDEYDPNGQLVGASDPTRKSKAVVYDPYKFFQTGLTFNNNIALSGGSGKSAYRMSLGNLHQSGIIPRSKYDKTTFNVSGQSALSSRLSISGGINFVRSANDKAQQGSNTSGVMLGLLRTPPTFDNSNGLKDAVNNPAAYLLADGTQRDYRGGHGYDNPYWTVNRVTFHEDLIRAFGYAQASYQLLDWMTLSYKVGGDVYSQNDKNGYDIGANVAAQGAVYLSDFYNQQYNSDVTISMKKTFSDDWSGSLLVGQNYFTLTSHAKISSGTGLTLPNFLDMANVQSYTAQEFDSRKRTSAYYGEAHLSFRDKLFLTVTGRRETSSTLPPRNNSFFYPSVSLAYEFFKPGQATSNGILNYGKLRGSFAQVGKDAPTQGLSTYYRPAIVNDGFTSGIVFPVAGVSGYQLATPTAVIGNPDLKAEKTNSYEFGTDLGFFKNRVSLNATLYYSKSSDVILTVPVAFTSGFGAELLNAAVITNKGLEITLNTTPFKSQDWRWEVNFNWARNVNLVKSLAAGVDQVGIAGFVSGSVNAVPGQPFGVIYGSAYLRSDPSNPKSPLLISDRPGPGYGMPIVGSQSAVLAKVDPDWTGSMITNLTYKGFNLGIQLDIRHGGHIWNGTRGAMSYFGTSRETANRGQAVTFRGVAGHLDDNGNIAHFDATGAEVLKPGGPNTVASAYNQYYWQNVASSFIGPAEASVEEDGFVRIRQASLGYQLPLSVLKNLHLKSLSLTLFANNPLLWTKYKGVDPETSLAGPANGQGIDYFNGPGVKNYGVRLGLSL